MRLSLVRLVAVLLLSGQMLPVGLPLLCKQARRATSANCEHLMPSQRSGPAVDVATTQATTCANAALCASAAAAVVALGEPASVSAGESRRVDFGAATFAPAEPRPPLPPPPQA